MSKIHEGVSGLWFWLDKRVTDSKGHGDADIAAFYQRLRDDVKNVPERWARLYGLLPADARAYWTHRSVEGGHDVDRFYEQRGLPAHNATDFVYGVILFSLVEVGKRNAYADDWCHERRWDGASSVDCPVMTHSQARDEWQGLVDTLIPDEDKLPDEEEDEPDHAEAKATPHSRVAQRYNQPTR